MRLRAWYALVATSREDERLRPVHRRGQLVTLDRAGGVHVFGTHLGALAHERAAPDALVLRQGRLSRGRTLVARIQVVALGKSDSGWSNELRVQPIDRTCRVTQHAVDAHAVLLVLVQLLRRLEIFAFRDGLFLVPYD